MIKVNSSKKTGNIILEGNVGIDDAIDIKNKLVKTFKNNLIVNINVEQVESADIAVLQLLYSAFQYCAQENKQFNMYTGTNQSFSTILINSGFADYLS